MVNFDSSNDWNELAITPHQMEAYTVNLHCDKVLRRKSEAANQLASGLTEPVL